MSNSKLTGAEFFRKYADIITESTQTDTILAKAQQIASKLTPEQTQEIVKLVTGSLGKPLNQLSVNDLGVNSAKTVVANASSNGVVGEDDESYSWSNPRPAIKGGRTDKHQQADYMRRDRFVNVPGSGNKKDILDTIIGALGGGAVGAVTGGFIAGGTAAAGAPMLLSAGIVAIAVALVVKFTNEKHPDDQRATGEFQVAPIGGGKYSQTMFDPNGRHPKLPPK